jgi:hypothetical protein
MTKTAARAVRARIRDLRTEQTALLTGFVYANTGVPWCRGPAGPGHQEPVCDGCATAALCRVKAAEVTARIRQLEASLVPQVQGVLW